MARLIRHCLKLLSKGGHKIKCGKYLFLDNLDIFYSHNENNAEIRKLYFADNFNSPRGLEGRWRGHYSQKGNEIVAQNLLKNISNGLSE